MTTGYRERERGDPPGGGVGGGGGEKPGEGDSLRGCQLSEKVGRRPGEGMEVPLPLRF